MIFIPNPKRKDESWQKPRQCTHPEHNPPGMRVFPPGEHNHKCPGCGHTTTFVVNRPMC